MVSNSQGCLLKRRPVAAEPDTCCVLKGIVMSYEQAVKYNKRLL